jgi:hypothetical protein
MPPIPIITALPVRFMHAHRVPALPGKAVVASFSDNADDFKEYPRFIADIRRI